MDGELTYHYVCHLALSSKSNGYTNLINPALKHSVVTPIPFLDRKSCFDAGIPPNYLAIYQLDFLLNATNGVDFPLLIVTLIRTVHGIKAPVVFKNTFFPLSQQGSIHLPCQINVSFIFVNKNAILSIKAASKLIVDVVGKCIWQSPV